MRILGDGESPARLFAVSLEEGAPREILADFFVGGAWSWIARHPDGRISALGNHRQLGRGFFTSRGTERGWSSQGVAGVSPSGPRGRRTWCGGGFGGTRRAGAVRPDRIERGLQPLEGACRSEHAPWVSAERLTTGAGPDVAAAVSRDGTRLAFTTEHGSTRLWVFPLDPVARRLGYRKAADRGRRDGRVSALSPDGQFVAYNLSRPGIDRDELWITNIVDGHERTGGDQRALPMLVARWRAIAYNYFRLDKQPATGRVAVRQLGGKERFLSRWSTDCSCLPTGVQSWACVGTYEPCLRRIVIGILADDES